MKKILLTALLLTAAAFAALAQTGTIRELTGDVQLKQPGSNDFVAATAGDKVSQSTIVSTGFRSTAVVEIGSTVITVRPLTRLSLAEIQGSSGTESLNVNLQTGRVRVDVNPPAGTKASTTVQGPSATASVRGTSFEFDTVNLSVNEGTVAFSGITGPATMVSAGESSYVAVNTMPTDPAGAATAGLLPAAPIGTGTPSAGAAPKSSSAAPGGSPSAPTTPSNPNPPPPSGDLGVDIGYDD
jgi:hypothetical protein